MATQEWENCIIIYSNFHIYFRFVVTYDCVCCVGEKNEQQSRLQKCEYLNRNTNPTPVHTILLRDNKASSNALIHTPTHTQKMKKQINKRKPKHFSALCTASFSFGFSFLEHFDFGNHYKKYISLTDVFLWHTFVKSTQIGTGVLSQLRKFSENFIFKY